MTSRSGVATAPPERLVMDTTGLLHPATYNGSYVLLPADGNFDTIRARAQNIFEGVPALDTYAPARRSEGANTDEDPS
jgi:hypothetical protein